MPRVVDFPLSEAPVDVDYVISRVNTHAAEMLAYIGQIGLLPGTRFRLLSRAPFNGPLQLAIGDVKQVIGHELAGVLRVCHPDQFDLR